MSQRPVTTVTFRQSIPTWRSSPAETARLDFVQVAEHSSGQEIQLLLKLSTRAVPFALTEPFGDRQNFFILTVLTCAGTAEGANLAAFQERTFLLFPKLNSNYSAKTIKRRISRKALPNSPGNFAAPKYPDRPCLRFHGNRSNPTWPFLSSVLQIGNRFRRMAGTSWSSTDQEPVTASRPTISSLTITSTMRQFCLLIGALAYRIWQSIFSREHSTLLSWLECNDWGSRLDASRLSGPRSL